MNEALEFIRNLKAVNEDIVAVQTSLDARENVSDFQRGLHRGQIDAARMTLKSIERFYEVINR